MEERNYPNLFVEAGLKPEAVEARVREAWYEITQG